MTAVTVAEALLLELGIQDPKEIDLEAIAFCVGAKVRYSELESCEARIIGFGDQAVITVDPRHGRERARFSIGHELGHWQFHRGRSAICRSEEIGNASNASHTERQADGFAADLLLPRYLFEPAAAKLRKTSFSAVGELARLFQASRTATALRMIDYGPEPAILVCHSAKGRRWFKRGKDVPDRWFPKDELDPESNAFETLYGGVDKPQPLLIGADAWFDRREAEEYEVYEQTVRASGGEVLTLITFKQSQMLADR